MEIKIIENQNPKQPPKDDSKLGFGNFFSNHMLIMQYDKNKGGWGPAEIKPYGVLGLEPAAACLHYGQIVWEGMKCYHTRDGLRLFRPKDNFNRLNRSADRMCMPSVDVDYMVDALKEFLKLEKDWVPKLKGTSLYIRPCMIAHETFLGLHKADKYLLFIILSPSGPYFKEGFNPIKIMVEDKYVRAAKGGTGEAKTAGNYAASLKSAVEAKKKGFSQTLWLDSIEMKYVEEVGAMNIAFVINDEVITPELDGTILHGITRNSVLEICGKLGIKASERRISIDEVIERIENKSLTETFGMGTAAIIAPVGSISYRDQEHIINDFKVGPNAKRIYDELIGIQYGDIEDTFNWIDKIE